MHKILVIRLYFSIYALHVSDCISPSSGAIFISCMSYLVYAGICRYVWLLCCYSNTTARRMVSAYTKYDIQLIKRLLLKMDWYSPKHVERILKIKSNHKKFVHLVGYRRITIQDDARCIVQRQTNSYVFWNIQTHILNETCRQNGEFWMAKQVVVQCFKGRIYRVYTKEWCGFKS